MQSMKHAPRLVRPFRDSLDADPPFPKAVLATSEVAFGICGWPCQAQHDNRMLPQHGSKPESAKRLYTANRMILSLSYFSGFVNLCANIPGVTKFSCLIVFWWKKIKNRTKMNWKVNVPVREQKSRLEIVLRDEGETQQPFTEPLGFYSTSTESRSKKSSSIRGILSLAGHNSCGSTRNALARQSSSKSETHRNCVSILASVCRLKSHPHRRQRAASIGCVSFCWSRNRRICGPTRFRGFFMFRFQKRNGRECAILKGSEFRTVISLVSFDVFWKGGEGNRLFGPMNNFFKKIPAIVTRAPYASP
jgi:hypothetical protein